LQTIDVSNTRPKQGRFVTTRRKRQLYAAGFCLSLIALTQQFSDAAAYTTVAVATPSYGVIQAQLLATRALTPVFAAQSVELLSADNSPSSPNTSPVTSIQSQLQHAPSPVLSSHLPRTVGEVGLKYYNLDKGFDDTYGTYIRFNHTPADGRNTWLGEIAYLNRFGDDGTYFSAGNTHQFNDLYYSTLSFGTSAGGFFWPSFRADASLSRRWLPKRNFVSTLGFGYVDAKDDHSDLSVLLEGTYYFDSPWIAQAGVRINESDPGSIVTPSGYAALTYGRDFERFVTLRYGMGREGYQALTSPSFVVDFPYQELTLTWREWIRPDFGFNLVGYGFGSDIYDQFGAEFGLFKEF
jgi:YaiO family outer membrane protein